MKRSICAVIISASFAVIVGGCGSSDPKEPLFEERPECDGQAVTPLTGQQSQVISFLEIGSQEDGFDLDRDGEPDNKLAAVGSLARSAIEDSFENFSLIIPIEFFDFEAPGEDECVKFAMYLGLYSYDNDGDGDKTADKKGDCNDLDPNIFKGAAEILDNGVDDDCDGLADEEDVQQGEEVVTNPSTNTDDADGDGVTLADGDCDDHNAMVAPGLDEICTDGLDNDCDGNADWQTDSQGTALCSPYDQQLEPIGLDPLSFNSDGSPVIAFTAGSVTNNNGKLELEAGPSVFSVNIPVTDGLNLDLRISGATIFGDVVETPNGYQIENGHLGGIIDAKTADTIRGLDVEEINLTEENSLLDATFANILGTILALPRLPEGHEFAGCQTPDIDADQDGLEAFCDSNPLDDVQVVDICVDGDGTIYRDEVDSNGNVTKQCTDFTDKDGNLLFVDGISVEINFATVPAQLPTTLD